MKKGVILALAGFLAFAGSPAFAQRGDEVMPLDRIIAQIRGQQPGTFYDANGPLPGPNGEPVFRIKWMTPEGKVIWFFVDARSGRITGGAHQ
jgi:uncharacterized membrane protein YkoI